MNGGPRLKAGEPTPLVVQKPVQIKEERVDDPIGRVFPEIGPKKLTGPLRVEILQDAIFVPTQAAAAGFAHSGWSLYHVEGDLVESAAFRRFPNASLVGQSKVLDRSLQSTSTLNDGPYIYGGTAHVHFGHMLLTTLARVWYINSNKKPKIIMHGHLKPEHWFSHRFFREIMGAVGLTSDDFVSPKEVTNISEIIVPQPSFEELHSAHEVHGELGERIGQALVGRAAVKRRGNPIYFSKSKLTSGVWMAECEHEIESELARHGVRIMFPETMTVAEQVAAIEGASHVLGLMGSALHGALLSRNHTKIRAMNVRLESDFDLNFHLIDGIKAIDSSYFSIRDVEQIGRSTRFTDLYRLVNPRETARAFLGAAL